MNSAALEIEQRLLEEIDYFLEYQNTLWFYENVKIKGLLIPKPIREYSTGVVLTTELLEGQHLEPWLKTNPDQSSIDHLAQVMWDTFAYCFFEMGKMHSDPNPGNYLFTQDKCLGLIDLAASKPMNSI